MRRSVVRVRGIGYSQHLKREIKTSMELADPTFIDVHISHPLGGPQSKWKESNILLHKLYEQKRAFSNVYKLAAAAVATFVCSVAICECSFLLYRVLTLFTGIQ